jgi:hypothetical protein
MIAEVIPDTETAAKIQNRDFVLEADSANTAYDLLTPTLLDRFHSRGIFYGLSPARLGDMSLNGNGFAQARERRQSFLNDVLIKFGAETVSRRIDDAVFMLPNSGEPEVVRYQPGERQIISGPEAVVFQDPLTVVMQPQDCIPLYLFDPETSTLGFCHSGFRSIDDLMPAKTVELMSDAFGARPDSIHAVLGPGIGPGWYNRRYIITQDPAQWRDHVSVLSGQSSVLESQICLPDDISASILYPGSNMLLSRLCFTENRILQKAGIKATDAITYLGLLLGREGDCLSVDLQSPLVRQLESAGLQSKHIEVDPADTFQNAERGLLFSLQAETRNKALVHGNPIAVFGQL